jgi:hypothetical protein
VQRILIGGEGVGYAAKRKQHHLLQISLFLASCPSPIVLLDRSGHGIDGR